MRVLVVDDHHDACASIADFIAQLGHEALRAHDGPTALRMLDATPCDALLVDVRMPGMDGMALLARVRQRPEPPAVALMTAYGDAAAALAALRQGAVDYLRKPIDIRDLHRLLERLACQRQAMVPALPYITDDGIAITGPDMHRLLLLADRFHLAPELPCIIEGETGTGKELFARRIHHGGRADERPFIALNCAAIPATLFEAELFGYAPGAFTGGAPDGAPGKLALAAGGTLFLDEIGDLPVELQAKLLRVLEERAWFPLGSRHQRQLQARIVCATNVDLAARIHEGRFREDLYYRLKGCALRLPPLRERVGGPLPLARLLLSRLAAQHRRPLLHLAPLAEEIIAIYPWPGNVRQLLRVLEQALVVCEEDEIPASLLVPWLEQRPPPAAAPARLVLPRLPPPDLALDPAGCDIDAWQRAIVRAALEAHGGSPVRASAALGISRKVLYTLRKRYGLLRPDESGDEA